MFMLARVHTLSSLVREREREREGERDRGRKRDIERERCKIGLFLFFKGMTGELETFYLSSY
jgi:hypothetical protein